MSLTIQSLKSVLNSVKTEKYTSSQVCGIATMKVIYRGENGQGKIGSCVTKNRCFDTAGCQLVTQNLPPGVSSQECKVLYTKYSLFSFFCVFIITFLALLSFENNDLEIKVWLDLQFLYKYLQL